MPYQKSETHVRVDVGHFHSTPHPFLLPHLQSGADTLMASARISLVVHPNRARRSWTRSLDPIYTEILRHHTANQLTRGWLSSTYCHNHLALTLFALSTNYQWNPFPAVHFAKTYFRTSFRLMQSSQLISQTDRFPRQKPIHVSRKGVILFLFSGWQGVWDLQATFDKVI